ncbi:MAG: hypothetical protein ACRC7N_05515 [Clostridium sp.]
MELRLSCNCCGSTEFQLKELLLQEVEGCTYLHHEEIKKGIEVICNKCKTEDYIDGLTLKITADKRVKEN